MTRPGRTRTNRKISYNTENYALVCAICDNRFADDGQLGEIELHFDVEDGHDPDHIELKTVWVGPGPEPEKTAMNREQRRANERAARARETAIRGRRRRGRS